MTVTLRPGRLTGEIAAMPSKSDLHRLMIGAWLAGIDIDQLPVISEDIEATRDCLLTENGVLNCRESGSTLRFLLPVMAALGKSVTFTGEGRLPERPMQPLIDLLRAHGCEVSDAQLPITISGQLKPGQYELPGDVSSQYITGLLFSLPLLRGNSEIVLISPLESAGYVEMTLRTLSRFGIVVQSTPTGWHIPGGQNYQPPALPLTPEGDWSNAAFWLAAGVRMTGLDESSAQPDRVIAQLLKNHAEMDASQCPDLVPIMAVVMATRLGESRIFNAARLRIKESDRLAAMAQNLNAIGADVTELPDGLIIRGKDALRGGEVQSFGDHRIAMAFAVAGLAAEGETVIEGAEAASVSFPEFWDTLAGISK